MPTTKPPRPRGFRCPDCGGLTEVDFTRTREAGRRVVRRRTCKDPHCRASVHTVELTMARLRELYQLAGMAPPALP